MALNHVDNARMERKPDEEAVKMATRSELELVHSEFYFRHYAKSLFIALELLDRFPENIYLHAMVAENFYRIYITQKNHQSGKSVPLPDSRYPESYDRLLYFLQKLRIMEVASVGYNYALSQHEGFFADEEYLFAFWMASHLPVSEVSPDLIKDDYLQKFPQGRYREVISKTKF